MDEAFKYGSSSQKFDRCCLSILSLVFSSLLRQCQIASKHDTRLPSNPFFPSFGHACLKWLTFEGNQLFDGMVLEYMSGRRENIFASFFIFLFSISLSDTRSFCLGRWCLIDLHVIRRIGWMVQLSAVSDLVYVTNLDGEWCA